MGGRVCGSARTRFTRHRSLLCAPRGMEDRASRPRIEVEVEEPAAFSPAVLEAVATFFNELSEPPRMSPYTRAT